MLLVSTENLNYVKICFRNVAHIYGKPPDDIYRLILVDKQCFADWKETNT